MGLMYGELPPLGLLVFDFPVFGKVGEAFKASFLL